MFSFSVLAGTGSVLIMVGTAAWVAMKREEESGGTKAKKKKMNADLKGVFDLFDAFEQEKAVIRREGTKLVFKHDATFLCMYDLYDGDKHIFIYGGSKNLFNFKYGMKKEHFFDFEEFDGVLQDDQIDEFLVAFQRFMAKCYAPKGAISDKGDVLNERLRQRVEVVQVTHWQDFLPAITQETLREVLLDMQLLSENVYNVQCNLGTEDQHRFLRIEQTILPDLLQAFLSYSPEEQAVKQQDLLVALTDAKKILLDLEGTRAQGHDVKFRKNIELLKQLDL